MNKQQFLAMSLPFELKCLSSETGHVYDIISCHFGNYALVRVKPNNGRDFPLPINRIKPILHPLSDLTNEIEHNGEMFVPIEKLNELFGYEEIRLVHYINSGLGWYITSSPVNTAISFLDMYSPIQKLIEWHFDIAGLIEQGEAIDVNALDVNPYK